MNIGALVRRLIFSWPLHGVVILVLTLLTQLGGLAYLLAVLLRHGWRGRLTVFLITYTGLSIATLFVAPALGKRALPCWFSLDTAPMYARHPIYCLANRTYVRSELKELGDALSRDLARAGDPTSIQALDGGFPYFDWFPLLPHLSHRGGRSLDMALPYLDAQGQPTRATPSAIGYFVYEPPGADDRQPCRHLHHGWKTLRWDMPWLQGRQTDLTLDWVKLRQIVRHFADSPHVSKILLEPHLADRLNYSHPKVRFQGCRAARHDDHIHIQMIRN